jgi:hypothetical protein
VYDECKDPKISEERSNQNALNQNVHASIVSANVNNEACKKIHHAKMNALTLTPRETASPLE